MNNEAFDEASDAPRDPSRRDFISTVGTFGTAVAFGTHGTADAGGEQAERGPGEIPLRPLGRTGIQLSILGVGGHHLGDLATLDDPVAALDQAKQDGKVRFAGFTGHKSPTIHLKMLARAYPFDTVQMPLNCFDATSTAIHPRRNFLIN